MTTVWFLLSYYPAHQIAGTACVVFYTLSIQVWLLCLTRFRFFVDRIFLRDLFNQVVNPACPVHVATVYCVHLYQLLPQLAWGCAIPAWVWVFAQIPLNFHPLQFLSHSHIRHDLQIPSLLLCRYWSAKE